MGEAVSEKSFVIDKMAKRAEVLGIPGPKQGSAPCVLPDHSHPAHLYFDGKVWKYWCAACDHGFSLAEVRAVIAYAEIPYGDAKKERGDPAWRSVRPPGRVEVSRWAELLDFEAGLIEPRPVDLVVPDGLSTSALSVAKQVRLLLGLRSDRWRDQAQFTFTRRMARARTGLSEDRARAALDELRERRVIVPVRKAGRALVYRLGSALEVLGDENEVGDG